MIDRAYGGVFSQSVTGKFIRRGRVVVVTFRMYQQFHNQVRTGGCDSGKVTLRATLWAPAIWTAITSQKLPLSFRIGAFKRQPETKGGNYAGAVTGGPSRSASGLRERAVGRSDV